MVVFFIGDKDIDSFPECLLFSSEELASRLVERLEPHFDDNFFDLSNIVWISNGSVVVNGEPM